MMSSLELVAPPLLQLQRQALFLDLDGTLTPIRARPGDVALDPALLALLRDMSAALGQRMGIVSGRTVRNLQGLLAGLPLRLAGIHGLESTDAAGAIQHSAAPGGLDEARRVLADFAGRTPGLLLEDKGLALALHYRQAPRMEQAVRTMIEALAHRSGLFVQPGKMVVELKAGRCDKGTAIRAFMAELEFYDSIPVFLGDDETDEAGFAACAEYGGFGVQVGGASKTCARYCLPSVDAVLDWLRASLNGKMP